MEEFSIKNYKKRYILLILISPIILIFLICIIIKYGTLLINTNELIIDISSPVKIGEYLYYYFTIIGIELTALLSYAIWRTSVRSTNLAKAINDKEENRDKENVRECALTLYYDLIFKISILKELYSNNKLTNKNKEIKKIIVNSDWMKNIVSLRNILNRQELYILIDLYNSFLLLHDLGDNENAEKVELEELVNNIANKIFIQPILEYLWMDFAGEIESTLNSQYFMVYRKIQSIINGEVLSEYYNELPNGDIEVKLNNGNRKYIGEFSGGKLKNGTDEWENERGHISYSFKYKDYNIVEGKYYNKINEVYDLIFDCQFDIEGKQTTGKTTTFYNSKNIEYKGQIEKGQYEGEGNLYFDNKMSTLMFTGIWKKGKKHIGEYTNKNSHRIKFFKGEYKNNEPYSGEIEVDELTEFKGAYGFKGIVNEGKLIKGTGYKFNKKYFDDDFLKKHPEYIEDNNDYDYDYEQQEIPPEVYQEMIEDSIRWKNENDKELWLKDCGQAIELLEATWVDGECKLSPDDSLYKKYLGFKTIE